MRRLLAAIMISLSLTALQAYPRVERHPERNDRDHDRDRVHPMWRAPARQWFTERLSVVTLPPLTVWGPAPMPVWIDPCAFCPPAGYREAWPLLIMPTPFLPLPQPVPDYIAEFTGNSFGPLRTITEDLRVFADQQPVSLPIGRRIIRLDGGHNPLEVTTFDANGVLTTKSCFDYDIWGIPTQANYFIATPDRIHTYPLRLYLQRNYYHDFQGNPAEEIDRDCDGALVAKYHYEYDRNGQPEEFAAIADHFGLFFRSGDCRPEGVSGLTRSGAYFAGPQAGHQVTFRYDSANRLVETDERDAAGAPYYHTVTTYGYGNVLAGVQYDYIDSRTGHWVSEVDTYDGRGNIADRCLYDAGMVVRRQHIAYTYDQYGNWVHLVARRWEYTGNFLADVERCDFEGTRLLTYW